MAIETICKDRLTKGERTKLWNRYMWFYNGCTNFENFYGNGWAWVLRPLFEKYYNKEGQIDAMQNHLDWYNNEGQTASILAGIVAGMEEERAITGNVDQKLIRATKASMQGPVAGVGDSIVQGTLVPLLLGIGINLSEGGSALGALFYIITFAAIVVFGSYFLFHKGYTMGRSAMSIMTGDNVIRFIESFMLFGTIVVGALGANYVNATTVISWTQGESVTKLMDVVNGIFPKLLSLLLIFGCYYLVKKKNIGMGKMILGMLVAVVAGTYLGIF